MQTELIVSSGFQCTLLGVCCYTRIVVGVGKRAATQSVTAALPLLFLRSQHTETMHLMVNATICHILVEAQCVTSPVHVCARCVRSG